MKEYEVVATYLNGCAGEAYPQRSFEEVELKDPMDYIRTKHPVDFAKFVRQDGDTITYTYDNGCIKHIYEFTEI